MFFELKLNDELIDETVCETLSDARQYFAKIHPLNEYATLGYTIEFNNADGVCITPAMPKKIYSNLHPFAKLFGVGGVV